MSSGVMTRQTRSGTPTKIVETGAATVATSLIIPTATGVLSGSTALGIWGNS
jgi:hypothetical protein